ncbi:thioesterase family protein [Roseibium sp. RKSG952]|uniref:acyl-CoA thioesterase n=1 Tax=Roseibium sp. RKSG952 TaxID=2529384 RepID=UPI0012BC5BE4|nr:thioesterase family protein [Roseibium sp. RKSG952]MTH96834.1 acyl-CoA thioesterase [Roseibium sp. RKSG952]
MTDMPRTIADYPVMTTEKLRYRDLDSQGHVNNAVFTTFLEAGRIYMLFDGKEAIADKGASFVIARLELDYIAEIRWPGTVEIGSRVVKVGRSSITLEQSIFQNGVEAGFARTIIVQSDPAARKSKPLSEGAVERLKRVMSPAPAA